MQGEPAVTGAPEGGGLTFDRHLVLDQLGGWRGMVDASLPTVAFIVANGIATFRSPEDQQLVDGSRRLRNGSLLNLT